MLVLIAEDNPEMRRVIRQYVESLFPGLQAIECSDGAEAAALYATHNPDLVLMDIRMQPVDGLTATAEIIQSDPHARICIVTNFNDQYLREAACAAGANAYVTKDRLADLRDLLEV